MHDSHSRRSFLTHTAAGLAAGCMVGRTMGADAPTKPPRVAAITTTYHRYSHADNIITRFMEGYSIVGTSFPPPGQVKALYIEQVGDLDIGRPLARRYKVPLVKTVADALTLGTGKLAVDAVLLVGEHGEYPDNERGQKMYPRRRLFEEIVKVFRDSKRAVPVFNDKHLSYSRKDAKWMYDQSRKLGFPLMAGSSIPVTYRKPELRPERGTEWDSALSVGYGHYESYGFHTLEALQCIVENRKGGETGVKAVQCIEGKDVWPAAKAGLWDRALLDAIAAVVPGKRGTVEKDDPHPIVYRVEYNSGLKAAAYMSNRYITEFAFGGRQKGVAKPRACWYQLPKPQRDHFSFLVSHIAHMFQTGKTSYPVERTLLTGGMLDYLMESKATGGKRLETPDLAIRYTA